MYGFSLCCAVSVPVIGIGFWRATPNQHVRLKWAVSVPVIGIGFWRDNRGHRRHLIRKVSVPVIGIGFWRVRALRRLIDRLSVNDFGKGQNHIMLYLVVIATLPHLKQPKLFNYQGSNYLANL